MRWTLATYAQAGLIGAYFCLTILFFREKEWPVVLYYLGCIVKDAGVLLLALLTSKR